MNTNDNGNKSKTAQERGVAENEKANYSGFPQEESTEQDDKDDIRETNDPEESEDQGGGYCRKRGRKRAY